MGSEYIRLKNGFPAFYSVVVFFVRLIIYH